MQFEFPRGPIECISSHRMPKRGQVYADLVSAPGSDVQFQQTEFSKWRIQTPNNLVVGDRLASARAAGCHSRTPHAVSTDAAGNGSTIRLNPTMNQSDVSFLHLAPGKLCRQASM